MAEVNDFLLEFIKIIVLGATQGFAEFMPVSAQMRYSVMQKIIGADVAFSSNPFVLLFLQLGTLFAIIFIFRKNLSKLVMSAGRMFVKIFTGKFIWKEARTNQKIAVFILLSYVPVLILIPFLSFINKIETMAWLTGAIFIISGVAYLFADRVKVNDRHSRKMNFKDAAFIAIANLIGFIPGVSGVGLTATVCSTRRFKKDFCAEYAFFLAIPAVLVNSIILLVKGIAEKASVFEIPYGFFGMFMAFGTGIVSIKIIRVLLKKRKMYIFAAISAILGGGLIAYQFLF